MEELITEEVRWGIELTQDVSGIDIHFIVPSRTTVRLNLEYFLKRLYDIKEPIDIHASYGVLHIVPIDRYRCKMSFDDRHSPDAMIVHHKLGVVNYKDLLTAINMELNTLRLRDRREEVFKVPEWSRDGGPFW